MCPLYVNSFELLCIYFSEVIHYMFQDSVSVALSYHCLGVSLMINLTGGISCVYFATESNT